MRGFMCEHCGGAVRKQVVDREAFRHKGTFVILEHVPISVCSKCGARYFGATVLRRVAEIGRGLKRCERSENVAVAAY